MKAKKILGLDIGTTSIGWAIVEATEEKRINEKNGLTATTDINNDRIGIHKDAVGVRIISADEMQRRFDAGLKLNEGEKLTPTAKRRVKRGARRLKSRYKLRRDKLCTILEMLGMLPDASYERITNKNGKRIWRPVEDKNSKWYSKKREYESDEKGIKKKKRTEGDIGEQLYKLRKDAVSKNENIDLKDWGRIILHLNQWRGYSSDRFKKDDKPKFDYYTAKVLEFDPTSFTPIYDKKEKGKLKYNQYRIKIETEEGIEVGENDEAKMITEFEGYLFSPYPKEDKTIPFKEGETIAVKKPEWKQNKKGKTILEEYYLISITTPDPEDWNYRYQNLNKTLEEWCNSGGTVGSYFYQKNYIEKSQDSRIRNNIVNRNWYEDEFDKIFDLQFERHKEHFAKYKSEDIVAACFKDVNILNEVKKKKSIKEQLRCLIKEKVIYYQRPWQQSKNKAECRFEKVRVFKKYFDKETKTYRLKTEPEYEGRKVVPRSHPLHQEFKIWQQINNVRLFYSEPNKHIGNNRVEDVKIDIFSEPERFKEQTGKSIQDITGKTIPEIKELLYETLQNQKTYSWKKFVEEKLGLQVADEIENKEGKGKRKTKKQGIDTETGEILKTFYTVNFRKLKRDRSSFENIPLKGNTTKRALKDALFNWFKENNYLKTQIEEGKETVISDTTGEWFNSIAKSGSDKHRLEMKNKKGEEIKSYNYQTKNYEITNLQLLWEIIYDITNKDEASVKSAIENNFKENDKCIFPDDTLTLLSKIKFDDNGMGNLSAKAIRNLLPLMSNGENITDKTKEKIQSLIVLNSSEEEKAKSEDEKLESIKDFVSDKNSRKRLSQFTNADNFKYLNYWEAAAVRYGSHSAKKIHRVEKLERIPKGKMNNPVVEKIVNETLMLVNDIVARYGKLDEIRIELSRELKASADERKQMDEAMRGNNERNELAKRMLRELFEIPSPSLNDLTKFKVYEDAAKIMDETTYVELKEKGTIDKTETYSEKGEEKNIMYEGKENKKEFIDYEKAYKEFGLKEPRTADINRYKLWMEQLCQCPYTGEMIKLSDVFTDKYEVEHIIPKQRYYDNSYSNKVITRREINQWKDKRTAYEFIVAESGKTKIVDGKELKILEWDGKKETDPYPAHVIRLFPKGRKQKNLLRKDIPSDPIERQLKETQYINKKLREELSKILPEGKEVQVTTGAVTDILRDSWHLNDVMKELVRNRYQNFKIGLGSGKAPVNEPINYSKTVKSRKTGKEEEIEVFPAFSKRLDHRHHALDAIIVACTKQWHIQYINTLNASWSVEDVTDEKQKAGKYEWNKEDILRKNEKADMKTYDFIYPWKNYTKNQIQEVLERTIVSHKNTIPLLSPSKNLLRKNGEIKIIGKPEDSISIRASLHKETLIGYRKFYNNSRQVPIEEIIEKIFEYRSKARVEIKPVLSFEELIDRIVFKERFRKQLKEIFETHSADKKDDSEIKNSVLRGIARNKPFEWAYTFDVVATKTGTDKGGTIDKLSPDKITDERIGRYLRYRKRFIDVVDKYIKHLKKKKPLDDHKIKINEDLLKKLKDYPDGYPIYYNAVYDVRVPSDKRKWIPITKLNQKLFDRIEYHRNKKIDSKRTEKVKDKLLEYRGKLSWKEAFKPERVFITEPPIIGKTGIKIKKASQKNKTTLETLYPIRPKTKTYVELDGNFRVYVFENTNGEREWRLLSNMDAMLIKKENKANKTEKLYPSELVKDLAEKGFGQIFSFGKNDTIFINPSNPQDSSQRLFSKEHIKDELFNWDLSEINTTEIIKEKQKNVSNNLWQVAIISDSETGRSIEFIQMHTAVEIKIPINEINTAKMQENVRVKIETMKNTFNTTEKAEERNKNRFLEEQVIFKNKDMFENCVKVYVDKLGKKIVPYWKFENDCWNKEKAKELGLIK